VNQVTAWLQGKGYAVQNVEGDRRYQQLDIDLLAVRDGRTCQVEVKYDRYQTPNLAFETVSNTSKWTTGCFMRTAADVMAYVRVTDEALGGVPGLTLLPMAAVRPWFVLHEQEFRLYRTSTPVGASGIYETVGRLVPLKRLLDAGLGVRHLRLP
jgi:Holliday junction resolvase-like predicted endonuclease